MLRECNYRGEIKNLGVLTPYYTPHGGAPFVTESPELTRQLPDAANVAHMWQGNFRVGCFDRVLAKYAIDVCRENLDGLVITCVDRIQSLGKFKFCRSYRKENNPEVTYPLLTVSRETGDKQLKRQEKISQSLGEFIPNVETFEVGRDAVNFLSSFLEKELNVPILAVSNGPTEKDKIELRRL